METIEFFRSQLHVSRHALDEALETHATLQERIARRVVHENTAAQAAKDDLARVEARLLRDEKDDNPKATDTSANAAVRRHPERITSWERSQRAREQHEEWQALLEAWRQRGYSIKALADLYGNDYYTLDTTYARPVRAATPVLRRRGSQ